VGLALDIDEDGDGARLADAEARGDERVGRADDLVARPDVEAREGDVEGAGAAGGRDGETGAAPVGELLLELHAAGAGPVVDLPRAQAVGRVLDSLLREPRPLGPGLGADGSAAIDCQCLRHHADPPVYEAPRDAVRPGAELSARRRLRQDGCTTGGGCAVRAPRRFPYGLAGCPVTIIADLNRSAIMPRARPRPRAHRLGAGWPRRSRKLTLPQCRHPADSATACRRATPA